jgi:hypothetical protein
MKNKRTLYLDQYGNRFWAKTVKELRNQIGMGGSRVSKMYQDRKDGSVVHVGYVVGPHWLTAYQPMERPA